jgi:hypothetical protein
MKARPEIWKDENGWAGEVSKDLERFYTNYHRTKSSAEKRIAEVADKLGWELGPIYYHPMRGLK